MKRKNYWTRDECVLVVVSTLILLVLGISLILLAVQLLSNGISSLHDWINYIPIVGPLIAAAIIVPKYTLKKRHDRLEIERKLQRILTTLELHLQRNNDDNPKFFRSPIPYWIDIANGYVLRRIDLVRKLGEALDESGLVLVLGHSGAGKTYLSYSSGYWGLIEKREKYRYVYYDNVSRASKLCLSDSSAYSLTDSIRECATDIADAMEKHEEFNRDKVLIILDDVHLRRDSLKSLGTVYNELPQSVKDRIHILLLGRALSESIHDDFEGWAYHLYEQRMSQLLTSFEMNRQHYKDAASELAQTFFNQINPRIECNIPTRELLVENADQSLRIVSLLLELCQDIVVDGVLNHTNIGSINICDAIEKYQRNLSDDFKTWRTQNQIRLLSSTETKMKSLLFLLATFNQMEIPLSKEFLYSNSPIPSDEVDTFIDFLFSSGELISSLERITIPHLSLSTHIVKCGHMTTPNLSYEINEGKEKFESLCIELLKTAESPFDLERMIEFGLKIQFKWAILVHHLKTDAQDLLIQLMERIGVRIVHYLEVLGDTFANEQVREMIVNRILNPESSSNLIESIGIIRFIGRNAEVLDAIARRIQSSAHIFRVLRNLTRFDYMFHNKQIISAIDKRINEIVEFLKTDSKPWMAIGSIDHPLILANWPILHETILTRSELFAEVLESDRYLEMDSYERYCFFSSFESIPCLVSREDISNQISNMIESSRIFSSSLAIRIRDATDSSTPFEAIITPSIILRQDCIATRIIESLVIAVRSSLDYRCVIDIMSLFYYHDDLKEAFESRLEEIVKWFADIEVIDLNYDLISGLVRLACYESIENMLKSRISFIASYFDNLPNPFLELVFQPNRFLLKQEPINEMLTRRLPELLARAQGSHSWDYSMLIGRIIDSISDSSFVDQVANFYLVPQKDLTNHLSYLSASSEFIKNERVQILAGRLLPEIVHELRYGAYPWQTITSLLHYPYLIESQQVKQIFLERLDETVTHISTEEDPIYTIYLFSQIKFINEIKRIEDAIVKRLDHFAHLIRLEGEGNSLLFYIFALAKFADHVILDEAVAQRFNVITNFIKLQLLDKDDLKLLLLYPSVNSNLGLMEEIKKAMNKPE